MRAVIFGVTGFIGSHLARHLLDEGWEVVGVHRDWNPSTPAVRMGIYDEITVARGDIADSDFVNRVVNKYEPDRVFLLSAQAIVRRAGKYVLGTLRTNIIGAANVFEACLQHNVPVLFMSTDKVYGNRVNAKETDPLMPVDVYGISKACADQLAQDYIDRGLEVCITRSCNVYGYDLNPRIVPNVIRQCLQDEQPEIFKANMHNTRQYIYIDDLISAFMLLVSKKRTVGVWNVGTNDVLTQEEVVKTICKFFNVEPVYVEGEPIREISSQSVDWSKIRALGFEPEYSFEGGVDKTIKMFREYGW